MANCKKEYRTQWELNSHHRLKHSKYESKEANNVFIVNLEDDPIASYELDSATASTSMGDTDFQSFNKSIPKRKYGQTDESVNGEQMISTPKKKCKKNNNQQIIYLMPGPVIENVISYYFVMIDPICS